MPLNRRDFIKGAAGVGGAMVLGQRAARAGLAIPNPPPLSMPAPLADPAGLGIEHIVVIMMENRSTDHLLAWHPTADIALDRTFFDTAGHSHQPYDLGHIYMGCGKADPNHNYDGGRTHLNGGAMDGFLKTAPVGDLLPIGYYSEAARPWFNSLARNFTVCDRYFCSTLTSTFPNRMFVHAAATDRLSNSFNQSTLPTIWDRIADTDGEVTGACYFQDLPTTARWWQKYIPITHRIEKFYADAAAGTLPNVVYVDPRALEEGNTGSSGDDHPHADIRVGEHFMQSVFNAVAHSPLWAKTVFIITYDEWGGFFDHVAPPRVHDASSGLDTDLVDGKALLGLRVPTIVASPWTKGDPRNPRVSSATFDHSSIPKLIESVFGLDRISSTSRDNSTDIADLAVTFDPANYDPTLPALGTAPLVVPTPCNPFVPEGDWVDFARSGLLEGWNLDVSV